MNPLNWFKRRMPPQADVAELSPLYGISPTEVLAAMSVIETLGPEVDRRILKVEVVADGRLHIATGHVTDGLNASIHDIVLERGPDGWRVVDYGHILS